MYTMPTIDSLYVIAADEGNELVVAIRDCGANSKVLTIGRIDLEIRDETAKELFRLLAKTY